MLFTGEEVVPATRAVTEKGERTRRRIVGHATVLIYDKGYGMTSVNDVIGAAGITKGSFYFHFDSKEDLGYAVIENASTHVLERMKEALDRPGLSPGERLESMYREVRGIVEAADCARGCILGNLALEMSHVHDGFRRRLAEAFKSWSSLVAGVLEEMKSLGELPAGFDCDAFADYIVSTMEGGIMMSKLSLDPSPIRNCISLMMGQLECVTTRG